MVSKTPKKKVKPSKETLSTTSPLPYHQPKCTLELAEEMANYIRIGLNPAKAYKMKGIKTTTFDMWMHQANKSKMKGQQNAYTAFLDVLDKAVVECETRDVMNIDSFAFGKPAEYVRYPEDHPRRGELQLDGAGNPILLRPAITPDMKASMWRLERRFKKDWAAMSRHEVSGINGAPIETEQTTITPEERAAKVKALASKLKILNNG